MDYEKLERVLSELKQVIAQRMSSVGLYYNVFGRVKSAGSLKEKIQRKTKSNPNYHLQDVIGIRIVLYFADDVELVSKFVLSDFNLQNTSIDEKKPNEISAIRNNYVYEIPAFVRKIFCEGIGDNPIDNTFELQIRTINSECWHEINHDYIYKTTANWNNAGLERQFNSILASYEIIETSTLNVFSSMCNEFYERKDILNLLKFKFRIRIQNIRQLPDYITKNPETNFLEVIYKVDRNKVLGALLEATCHHEPELEIEDLLNECLKQLKMKKMFETKLEEAESFKDIIKNIEGLNPLLGTIHDEMYLEYRKFIEGLDEAKPSELII